MDKRLAAALIFLALLSAEQQIGFGLGQSIYQDCQFPFTANTGFTELTLNPYSRLQFGLKYTQTGALWRDSQRFNSRGLLGSVKLYLNPFTAKTPYLGYNFGWVNTEVIADRYLYTGRGVYCGEALAGYSFRWSEWDRLNVEYSRQTIDNAYAPDSKLVADTWTLVWSVIPHLPPPPPVRKQTPEDGVTTRKEYLSKKIAHNKEQIVRYDLLIAKYNQKITEEGPQDSIQKERDYLIGQKRNLESDNRQMLELLEK